MTARVTCLGYFDHLALFLFFFVHDYSTITVYFCNSSARSSSPSFLTCSYFPLKFHLFTQHMVRGLHQIATQAHEQLSKAKFYELSTCNIVCSATPTCMTCDLCFKCSRSSHLGHTWTHLGYTWVQCPSGGSGILQGQARLSAIELRSV